MTRYGHILCGSLLAIGGCVGDRLVGSDPGDASSSGDGGAPVDVPLTSTAGLDGGDAPPNPSTTASPMPGETTTPADPSTSSTSGDPGTGVDSGVGSEVDTGLAESAGGPACGNAIIEPGEQCDGEELGGFDCPSLGLGGGTLACDDNCTFDVIGCDDATGCGNGIVEFTEYCDGDDLLGWTCEVLGLGGGMVACNDDCTLDTSMCAGAP